MTRTSDSPPSRPWAEWISLAAVLALTLATLGWLAGFVRQSAAYAFDSDEGIHAYEALRVSAYLRDGDAAGALAASLEGSFYPPIHSWLLGISLAVLGATSTIARSFGLAIYALDVMLVYGLGRWLARPARGRPASGWPWLAGPAAALPMLAAPPMWVTSSLVYLEPLGILFVLVAFWGYWQGISGRGWGWWLAGLGIVANGLVKYPYWPLLAIPLPLALALRCRHDWRALPGRLAALTLPSAVAILVWVSLPATHNGLAQYIAATQDLAARAQPSFFENLAFYVKGIAIHFSPSPWMAVMWGAALAAALARWRDERLEPLVIFIAWVLASISTHGGLSPRFLTTAMPAVWLIGGVGVARAAAAWPSWEARRPAGDRRWIARLAAMGAIAGLAVTIVLGLVRQVAIYPRLYEIEMETDPRAMDIYEWMAAQVPAGPARIGLVNDWDQMNGYALGWELTTRRTPAPRRADLVTVWEMHSLPQATEDNVADESAQLKARQINYVIAYTSPGVGVNRLNKTVALMGERLRAIGERDFPLRWYWPYRLAHRLYDGEYLDDEQLRQRLDEAGTDRSLTVHVYAFTPESTPAPASLDLDRRKQQAVSHNRAAARHLKTVPAVQGIQTRLRLVLARRRARRNNQRVPLDEHVAGPPVVHRHTQPIAISHDLAICRHHVRHE